VFLGALAANYDSSNSKIIISDNISSNFKNVALAVTSDFHNSELQKVLTSGSVEWYSGTIVNCGASSHFTPLKEQLTNYKPIMPSPICIANGCVFYTEG
jgi:hypothetical protein